MDAADHAVLEELEGLIERHPYLRLKLGQSAAGVGELERLASLRLAYLHLTRYQRQDQDLLLALSAREKQLAAQLRDEAPGSRAALLYDTARLLHPMPKVDEQLGSVSLSTTIETWERKRSSRAIGEIVREKLQQNRDFFRMGTMLPLYWWRRLRIRRSLPKSVLAHRGTMETYFAIEQIGPIVDNFGFKGRAGLPWNSSVGVADLAFLYMQLADEFLDELAAGAGRQAVGELIRKRYRAELSERPLRDLSMEDVRTLGVDVDAQMTKYGNSLAQIHRILEDLAARLDDELAAQSLQVREAAHRFLHHCVQTYLDEVELCESAPDGRADRLALPEVAWHFYRKNNLVMMFWLDLRARTLGLEPADHADAIARWGYLLATFQIFDDLKDIGLDLGRQPSYPLQIAANEFPAELAWLESRFSQQRRPITQDDVPEVNQRAAGTVLQCMRLSRLMALAHFDNPLLYAWDQRWRRSWTERRKSFNPAGHGGRGRPMHVVDRLLQALAATDASASMPSTQDERLAFALDTAAYDGAWPIYLALFPDIRAIYRFATLRMWMTASEKARACQRLLRRHPERARAALSRLGLADRDVDHQVGAKRFEALS
jgi:hypothetical protein